jgi:hypothetical protein
MPLGAPCSSPKQKGESEMGLGEDFMTFLRRNGPIVLPKSHFLG